MYPHELPQHEDKKYKDATILVAKKADNMAAAAPGIDRRIYEDFFRSRYFELLGYSEGLQDAFGLSAEWGCWSIRFSARWLESHLSKLHQTESI